MITIPTLSGNSYKDVSCAQLRSLQNLQRELENPFFNINIWTIDAVRQTALRNLNQQLPIIQQSLSNRTWCRILWDVITFQFIKVLILQCKLPSIIASVNRVVTVLNTAVPGVPQSPVAPTTPSAAPSPRPILIVSRPANLQQRIDQKLDLTSRAFEVFKSERDRDAAQRQNDPQWIATAIEVNDYFELTISKLRSKENVPIPMYFHASRNGVEAIAKDKVLKMSDAYRGRGTYFSTRDEHYNHYGNYTYAIDADAIEQFPAAFFNSGASYATGEESGLWVRVEADVPVSGENVAYIAVPDEQSRKDILDKFWQDNKVGFYAHVITRAASDWIRKSFTAVHCHGLPKTWRRHENEVSYALRLKHVAEPGETVASA